MAAIRFKVAQILLRSSELALAGVSTVTTRTCVAPAFRALKGWGLRRAVEYVERNWLVALWLKDPQWRVLDTFDAITPTIATTHTEEEVADWLTAAR